MPAVVPVPETILLRAAEAALRSAMHLNNAAGEESKEATKLKLKLELQVLAAEAFRGLVRW